MLGRKVIYVRCINCSYNNVAKGVRLLDKKAIFVYTGKIMQIRAFERYIALKEKWAKMHDSDDVETIFLANRCGRALYAHVCAFHKTFARIR